MDPIDRQQLDELGLWIPSRRFAVEQGAKVRPIDDYSVSRINDTVTSTETIDPDDLQVIVASARLLADSLCIDPALRHDASPFRDVQRHSDHVGSKLVGRMYDIASAYKHLAVRPSQAHLAVVAV